MPQDELAKRIAPQLEAAEKRMKVLEVELERAERAEIDVTKQRTEYLELKRKIELIKITYGL